MPFKSEAQHRKFRVLLRQGKISQAKFDEWMDETKKLKGSKHPIKALPERVKTAAFREGFEKEAKKLTARGRKRISEGNFVFPKTRRYPIHDISHARNALARVSQFGNPAEQAEVRSAVYNKYPSLKK